MERTLINCIAGTASKQPKLVLKLTYAHKFSFVCFLSLLPQPRQPLPAVTLLKSGKNGVLAGYEVEKTQIRCATLDFCAACCPRVWHNLCNQKNMVGFTSATTTAITSRYFAQKRQNGVLAGYEVEKTQIRCATLDFCAACCPRV